MKRLLGVLFSGVLAGIMISIGGGVFLAIKGTSLIGASFLFSLGLFMIISLKLHLYTGKVGYIFENKKSFLLDLFQCHLSLDNLQISLTFSLLSLGNH